MDHQTINNTFQMTKANSVRVLETSVLHASDVIYWLDGSSANAETDMKRVTSPLQLSFSTKPNDVKVAHGLGRTAMWREPQSAMVEGRATEAERTNIGINAGASVFNIAGEVRDLNGRYNPRLFSLNLGAGKGNSVVLYPSLLGISLAPSGRIQGCLKYSDTGEAVAWGLLVLEVTVGINERLIFHAQADKKGDFRISLKRLPPLPENRIGYRAVLRLRGVAVASDKVVNISDFVDLNLESAAVVNDFKIEMVLTIRSGEITRINSFNKTYIAVQTV